MDGMSDVPPIDPHDVMLDHFAFQFDLRERYQHMLEQILAIKVQGRAYKDALAMAQEIARDALDEETIKAWIVEGRPLPWIDMVIGEDAAEVQRVVDEARSVPFA